MKFCPKCKGLLIPVNGKYKCLSCGYEEAAPTELKETVAKKKESTKKVEEEMLETLPTVAVECPKCKHKEAFWYTQQTRASDEPETHFFICKKCKHRWRKY
ncbi:MAG: transcription factor S [Candidatus Nanoarchaeia archaeon]